MQLTIPFEVNPRASLFGLPQELQDLIFHLAYPEEIGAEFVFLDEWDYIERDRVRIGGSVFDARPSPAPKVQEFLVSKKFFAGAAEAWVHNQELDEFLKGVVPSYGIGRSTGIIGDYLTRLKTTFHSNDHMLHELPSLTELELKADDDFFEVVEPKLAGEEVLTTEDLEKTWSASKLELLPRLRVLKLSVRNSRYHRKDPEKLAIFEQNLQQLEDFVKPTLAANNPTFQALGKCEPRP